MPDDRMPVEGSRCALQAWFEKRAAADAQLRAQFLNNSNAALERLAGKHLPPGIKIVFLEESPQTVYLVRRFEGAMEPFEPETGNAQLLSRSLHALALAEDNFWNGVKADPRKLLAERLALQLGPQTKVEILEEDANTAYFVLHHDDHYRNWKPPAPVMSQVRIKK